MTLFHETRLAGICCPSGRGARTVIAKNDGGILDRYPDTCAEAAFADDGSNPVYRHFPEKRS